MDTETGPGKSKASSHGKDWRWRIMSLTILPGKPFQFIFRIRLEGNIYSPHDPQLF